MTSQKLTGSLGLSDLKSFHGFVTLGGRVVAIAFLAFYLVIKLWEVLVWKIFTKKLYQTWPTAVKTLKKHRYSPTGKHKKSQILLTRFLNEYWGKYVPINKVFDSTHKENIKKARAAITPIVDILKLCGRQNIPLRVHKDNM